MKGKSMKAVRLHKPMCLAAAMAAAVVASGEAPVRDTRVYVDGAACRDLRPVGSGKATPRGAWTEFASPDGTFAHRWLTDASIGPGNFCVKARLAVLRPIFCDASIRIGGGDRDGGIGGAGGNITISGGTVTATSNSAETPAIGNSSTDYGTCVTITSGITSVAMTNSVSGNFPQVGIFLRDKSVCIDGVTITNFLSTQISSNYGSLRSRHNSSTNTWTLYK